MSGRTITIDAAQRRTLHRLIADRLSRADLVYLHLANGRPAEAATAGMELAQDLALMGEIGWEPEDSRERIELTLMPDLLLDALERYVEAVERSIFQVGVAYGLDNPDAAGAARSAQVCRHLIAVLDPHSPILTVSPQQRDELHWLLSWSLFRRDPAGADVASFSQDMRLMIGFGWLNRDQLRGLGWPEGELESYELTLPPEELEGALDRLAALARAGTKTEVAEWPGQPLEERRRRFAAAADLCLELLAELEDQTKGGAK